MADGPNPTDTIHALTVPDGSGGRVDRVVADLTGLSRSYVQHLTVDGGLTGSDGGGVRSNDLVVPGAVLRLLQPAAVPVDIEPQEIDVAVVYEDPDLLIVDKPAGLVVHPAPGHADGTLVNALLGRHGETFGGIAGVRRPGIVHRLDRDTSGLLIVARTDLAQASLMDQLKARRI